jgi:hypothetical protein
VRALLDWVERRFRFVEEVRASRYRGEPLAIKGGLRALGPCQRKAIRRPISPSKYLAGIHAARFAGFSI